MNAPISSDEVLAVQDGAKERPIPTAWRPVFRKVVDALVAQDYGLKHCLPGVESIPESTALHIRDYIQNYGVTLVELPDETWNSSVCMWYGNHWEVLVDLWTQEEGRSDLVLGARVTNSQPGFAFEIQMVYVP